MAETASPPASTEPHSQTQPASPNDHPIGALPVAQLVMAVALAWLVPGLGHVYLKRAGRGLFFLAVILATLVIGCTLQGSLYTPTPGQPLTYLATFGSMGMGIPYFVLRYGLHYEGLQDAPGFEYGTAFLLTAGLMNLLLVLDAWDIGSGKKE